MTICDYGMVRKVTIRHRQLLDLWNTLNYTQSLLDPPKTPRQTVVMSVALFFPAASPVYQ